MHNMTFECIKQNCNIISTNNLGNCLKGTKDNNHNYDPHTVFKMRLKLFDRYVIAMITKSIQTWRIDRDIAENAIDDTQTRPGLPRVLFELALKFFVPYRVVENFGKVFNLAIWYRSPNKKTRQFNLMNACLWQ
jgi:hypothetical protein